ncbi:ABC-2 family transporter protein [Clostridiaceae bacterium M8S5]|nr:ABC-2 family transporter protein [Clostridiaceae bacterium M8S5]
MSTIAKYARLFKRYQILSYVDLLQFPFEIGMKFLNLVFSIGTIYVFWISVFYIGVSFKNWGVYGIIILASMNVLSNAVSRVSFGFRDLEYKILDGSFDKYLVRPVHPIFTLLMERTSFFYISTQVMISIAMLMYCVGKGNVVLHNSLIAFLCLIIGTIALDVLYGTFTLLAFWFGKIYYARELVFSFKQAKKYPLDVFPKTFINIFTYFIPLAYLSTVPAKILLGKYNRPYFFLFIAIILLVINLVLFNILWKKALSRYNSTGS